MGGPREVHPEGVEPESSVAAAEEEVGEPRLQIAGFVRDYDLQLLPRNERTDIISPTFSYVSREMKYGAGESVARLTSTMSFASRPRSDVASCLLGCSFSEGDPADCKQYYNSALFIHSFAMQGPAWTVPSYSIGPPA